MNELKTVKLQRFSTHDGPGIRTVVFLKGCPLRCEWCHNPETQKGGNQIFFRENACIGCGACTTVCKAHAHRFDDTGRHIYDSRLCTGCLECAEVCPTGAIEGIGRMMSVSDIISEVMRDSAFFGDSGGITVSGGEPMFQPEGCINLLRAAKEKGLSTAIETCGYFDEKYIDELTAAADIFLWDFKDGNTVRHRKYTGLGNEKILKNLFIVDGTAKHIILRCIMIRGVNMESDNISAIADAYHRLKHCDGVELIPYHAYGGSKEKQLGGNDNGDETRIPSHSELKSVSGFLTENGVKLINQE